MRAQPAFDGQSISHYDLLEKVGEGGMGAVYRAHDRTLDRTVALKFLHTQTLESKPLKSRFLQEARAASRLNHRNIAVIHGIEECAGETFLVFEYLPGGTLRSLLESLRQRGTVLEPRRAAEYGLEMAEGLAHAHANGIIHRDIKPGNIMFGRDGSLKLVDFGLSKLRDSDETQTASGVVRGTPVYMSPEQAQAKETDERSDIFSLGLVLYEMVAGQPPFRADRTEAVVHQIIHSPAPPLPSSSCPPKLAEIIQRAMEKNPEARYQRSVELADDLRLFLRGSAALQERPTMTMETVRPVRRLAVFGVVVALLAIAVAILSPLRDRVWPRLPSNKLLAILPFENVGNDAANQAFCDGLLDSAIAYLRQVQPNLVATPAAEIRRLAIKTPDAARQLAGANVVVSGKVTRAGNRVEVNLTLLTPPGTKPIAAARVIQDAGQPDHGEQDHGEQGSVQEKTGAAMAKLLGLKTTAPQHDKASKAPAANEAYLEGMGYTERYDIPGNLVKAVEALERATQADPGFAAGYIALSKAYQARFRDTKDRQYLDRARESAAKAIELDDSSAGAHTASGGVLSLGGDQEAAIVEFRRALSLDPLNGDALRELAAAYSSAGRSADAEATYRKAAELKPNDPMTLGQLGQFYYAHQQYREAASQFQAVVALVPDSPTHRRNLAGVYIAMGRYADAERELRQSIALRPTSAAYSNLGVLYIYLGRYAEAIDALQQTIRLAPARFASIYTYWGNLGDAYRYTPGQSAKAADAYRHAVQEAEQQLAFDPDNAGLLASKAEYQAKMGDHTSALDAIGRAMRFAHGDKKVSFKAALVYELTGSRERALAALGDAIRGGYSLDDIGSEPELKALRQDPRYHELLTSQSGKTTSK